MIPEQAGRLLDFTISPMILCLAFAKPCAASEDDRAQSSCPAPAGRTACSVLHAANGGHFADGNNAIDAHG
jgi:hypothetical protein